MNQLDKEFWNSRYSENNTGWDIGICAPAFIEYFKQKEDKKIKILIPGGGRGHEAAYLYKQGFKNVFILDISENAIGEFKNLNPDFPEENIIPDDFFNHEENYDLILEQTFFCALNPSLRTKYVEQTNSLLKDNGKLVGLLFDWNFEGGPPFGGNKNEYVELFSKHFNIKTLESCNYSIKPRSGKELFMILEKK